MWRHHLLVALRALRRDAGYAALNGVGLTVALACCALIALYARSELSYDRFLPDADRLVVVGTQDSFFQETAPSVSTPYPLHRVLPAEAPAVDRAAMTSMGGDETPILRTGQPVVTARVRFASEGFFDVLRAPALAGDPVAALGRPDGAVLTATTARRLFGRVDAVGEAFRTEARRDTQSVTVAAVVADPPRTSSVPFDIVLSARTLPANQRADDSWFMWQWMTVARLAPGATTSALDAQLRAIARRYHASPDAAEADPYDGPEYVATPLLAFHLSELTRGSGFVGDPRYLALFSAAAALVLLLGFINYVNLATARASRRAREIGVRKALGAGRGSVAAQFLAEAAVLTVLSGAAAVALAALLLPAFNAGFETELALSDLDLPFLAAGLAFVVAVGLAAGAYPAAVLSGADPARVLRGGASRSGRPSRHALRRTLVAVQFAVAIGLVAGTGVVLQQIHFARTTDLGVQPGGVVMVPLAPERGPGVGWQAALDAARQSPRVAAATAASEFPGRVRTRFTEVIQDGVEDADNVFSIAPISAEPGYLDVLGIELLAGRAPRADGEVVVNEAFLRAKRIATPAEALGRTVSLEADRPIVGVVRDFHFDSMRHEVEPVVIRSHQPMHEGETAVRAYDYLVVRLAPGPPAEALADLRRAWAGLGTAQPFEPEFLDDTIAGMMDAERRLAGVIGGFALVALLVAGLGLVGLAAYTAQQRTREIGVRRALGATVGQVVALLSREYAWLVAAGAAVAVPAAVVLLGRWLDGFAYRIALSPVLFAASVALALALALGVVGVQAVRAARVPPTRALRSD